MSKIEWTDETWNFLAGCTKVSPGCGNCYAIGMAARVEKMSDALILQGKDPGRGEMYKGLTRKSPVGYEWTGQIAVSEKALFLPLKWRSPRKIFVNSMSDLFHEKVHDELLDKAFAIMALCPQHIFQILTKRPQRMQEYMSSPGRFEAIQEHYLAIAKTDSYRGVLTRLQWPSPNAWLGVTVENQQAADERIPWLEKTPAALRFLSCEPLLEQVMPSMSNIDWVIIGGESGPGARPFHIDWARSLLAQCRDQSAPVFVKQLGSNPVENHDWEHQPFPNISKGIKLKSRKGSDPGEWPEDLRVREFPEKFNGTEK